MIQEMNNIICMTEIIMNRKNRNIKRIGVLTSGGDCSGMNACIRAVTRSAIRSGIEVYGFRKGYQGILDNDFMVLDDSSVSSIIETGGTFLQSARCREFMTDKGKNTGLENLNDLCIEALIVIGGNGSITGAHELHKLGFPVIGIPASIDNDIYGTDTALGVDTALNVICRSVDMIRDTASSHDRIFVVEVMGRDSGFLTLSSAITTGSEAAIIPERKTDLDSLSRKIRRRFKEKKTCAIILTAEGAERAIDIATKLNEDLDYDIRISVLGHIQRGGSPTHFDRMLASMLGQAAVNSVKQKHFGHMIAYKNQGITSVPLKEVIKGTRGIPANLYAMSELVYA